MGLTSQLWHIAKFECFEDLHADSEAIPNRGCRQSAEGRADSELYGCAGAELYKEVKRASDSFLGIVSQCFVTRKASIGVPMVRGRPQYCANLAMKINAKLGGKNVALPKEER